MLRAAIFGAVERIDSRFGRLEPKARVAPRQNVLLEPKRGKKKIVDHILGCHHQFDWLPHRHVQLVDFPLPLRMLRFPHPLSADDANLEGVVWRAENVNKNDRAPDKNHHGQTERNQGPKDLQPEGSLDGSGSLIFSAAAIFDGEENNHEKDQRNEENRNGDKKKQKRVHLWRHGRGLLRKQRKPEIHASALPRGCNLRPRSRQSMTVMKAARAITVTTPPRRTMLVTRRLYFPVEGS